MGSEQSRRELEQGNHVALTSGGKESTVACHAAIRWGPADILVYLDTRTGAESNRRFIERFADHLGVQLWTLRTNVKYEDLVKENGHPGPPQHGKMYASLKERQIGRLATMAAGRGNKSDLHLWTGVRLRESMNRMGNVEEVQDGARWVWHAPLTHWTRKEINRYHDRFMLPTNYLWSTLGRSADCFCGAFGSPEELIDAEAAGCDRLVRYLRDIDVDREDEKAQWGWGGLSPNEQRAARAEQDDDQMLLCSDCGLSAMTDGGQS